jgi:hypothetical protein
MTLRVYVALIAVLSMGPVLPGANEAFARSGAVHGGRVVSPHLSSHPPLANSLRHHRRNHVGGLWPTVGGFWDGPSTPGLGVDVTQPLSNDVHHQTITYDVPWDWAHRYPPAVAPSDRAYVPSCPTENVTVSGRDGQDQTISVVRCY